MTSNHKIRSIILCAPSTKNKITLVQRHIWWALLWNDVVFNKTRVAHFCRLLKELHTGLTCHPSSVMWRNGNIWIPGAIGWWWLYGLSLTRVVCDILIGYNIHMSVSYFQWLIQVDTLCEHWVMNFKLWEVCSKKCFVHRFKAKAEACSSFKKH
jgi:hypothetical protein